MKMIPETCEIGGWVRACVFLHNLVFVILLCMSVRKALQSLCNIVVYVQTLTLYKSLGTWCIFHVTLEQKVKGRNIQKPTSYDMHAKI
jgi:hypothetical protein